MRELDVDGRVEQRRKRAEEGLCGGEEIISDAASSLEQCPRGCNAGPAHLPFTKEKLLCARDRISLSKCTRNATHASADYR